MKKTLLALAVLAASGASFAQSSVTLFGVVDATLTFGRGDVSNLQRLHNSGYNSSRLGFKGTEDLGGGMNASFWVEAGMNNDDGTGSATNMNNQPVAAYNATTGANSPVRAGTQGLTFNRKSVVTLGGGFGEVRLGRDYTPTFYNTSAYDAFGTNGVGTSIVAVKAWGLESESLRASNSISYFLPGNLGGFGGQVMYVMGENASTGAKDGNGLQARGSYNNGPISAGVAYGVTKRSAGDSKVTNFGASYDFGVVKLMGMYSQDKIATLTGKGFNVGVTAPVGAGEVRASYNSYKTDAAGTPKTNQFALGYVHNLSKRTALYTTIARVSNSGGASTALNGATTSANGSSTGYDFGVKHSF
ncbi:MAG: porin [Burkholderiaceae bacterium]